MVIGAKWVEPASLVVDVFFYSLLGRVLLVTERIRYLLFAKVEF